MAVWEDVELASPHNQGTCLPLVGDSDAQGDERNPKVNQQDVGGLSGEEKWRPDRIGAPEAREIRRGKQEGPSRRSRRGVEGDCPAHSGTGSLLSSQAGPLSTKAHPSLPAALVLGAQEGGWGDEERQVGGAFPDHRLQEKERRGGCLPCPLKPRKPAGLPGEVPCPLRPGVGVTPGPLMFLEPKSHLPQSPGPFPALWVLSIGPAHCPNLALAQVLPSTAMASPPLFFSFSSSFFLTIVVLMYLTVADSSIFLFLHSF